MKVQVPSFPASTIDLTNSKEEEDERISLVTVTEEVGNGNNLQDFMNLFSGSNVKTSSSLPKWKYYSEPCPSSSALLLSLILALFSLPMGSTRTPLMSHLYHDATCLPDSITLVSVQTPIPPSTVSQVCKVTLHIPSLSSTPSPVHEKV